jgi:hypothetical protein
VHLCACTREHTLHVSVKTLQCSYVVKAYERQTVPPSSSLLSSHAQARTTRMRKNVFSEILVRVHLPAHFRRISIAKNCRHRQKSMCSRRTQRAVHIHRCQSHSCTAQQRPTSCSNKELIEVSSAIMPRISFSLSFVFALSSAHSLLSRPASSRTSESS